MLQRSLVVQSKVLHIQHRKIPGFKKIKHFAKSGSVSAGEDAFPDPGTEGRWPVAPNEMKQSAPGVSDSTMDDLSQIPVIFQPDVLQHPDRHENIIPV